MNKAVRFQLATLVVLVAAIAVVHFQGTAIVDWYRLRNYQPPAEVSQIAEETTMTEEARHLFYLNKPVIADKAVFAPACTTNKEQSIVLGCYHGRQNGIWIYNVTDKRLDGIVEVTSAHEMLHAAYDRLSNSEKADIDSQLEAYYNDDLTDERIKKTIDAYRKTEPNDLVNEMHSIFGTEVPNLPSGLEQYYQRYFLNRKAVTDTAARYQAEFTSRQNQVATYDARLSTMRTSINQQQTDIQTRQQALGQQRSNLDAQRSRGDTSGYNAAVPAYNAAVDQYNNDVTALRNLVAEYNELVAQRNSVALEENQLVDAINSNTIPDTQ